MNETVRTAPWASDRALSRLAEVERALPDELGAVFAAAGGRAATSRPPGALLRITRC